MMTKEQDHLAQIFSEALDRVDPYKIITNRLNLSNEILTVAMDEGDISVNLNDFERIIVIGAGKATAKMALAIEEILGDRIESGIISVKYGHTEKLQYIKTIEAAHPVPDENGVKAAHMIETLACSATDKTLVINLISGGGSALLTSPMSAEIDGEKIAITLEDKQAVTKSLLACGADISEINCIRKHLSNLKGGRLLRCLRPARSLNFILSDVVGDNLDTIASGMTSFDNSTYCDAISIIDHYEIRNKIPPHTLKALELGNLGRLVETLKKEEFNKVQADNILIGTNRIALLGARDKAIELGYNVQILTSRLEGEAANAADMFWAIAQDERQWELLEKKPACIIAGGETVVTIKGNGKGGRNQEMALTFLMRLGQDKLEGKGIHFLAASTDGNDGPTDAAGGFADAAVLEKSRKMGLSIADYLKNNDSYHFLEKVGALHKTGPTNTNVCDVQVLIVK
ncbi:hydroxypyruvate reductase [Maridesulfovibrio ferrireducens]|uniref:Hydroxypyruvate reductase n=1 Tax=Maridesulfovibrio ferrireducens TaxID=246191 RepID=A0A1G9C0W7_9BACT|nr:glycerate kinase [Maridesulfovibrio ferrireducens]SDK44855.1 hydroxypyruvate reductase [Maridesulfovibrio ferrireducens]